LNDNLEINKDFLKSIDKRQSISNQYVDVLIIFLKKLN